MATLPQSNPYRCDQCGAGEIVAVPFLYQHGTRTLLKHFQPWNKPIVFRTDSGTAPSTGLHSAFCPLGIRYLPILCVELRGAEFYTRDTRQLRL